MVPLYPIPVERPGAETASIFTGALSALGASACCALPLILVSVGVGGAWLAQLRALEGFFPVFVILALAAFGFAFYRLYFRPLECTPAKSCSTLETRHRQRIAFWITLVIAKALIVAPFAYAWIAS